MSVWRRSTTNLLVGGILLVIIAMGVSFFLSLQNDSRVDVQVGGGLFKAQVANDQESRERGLAGVDVLADNEALLLVYDSDDTWGIWMKDMEIPIDIIWLNAAKEVIHIVRNVSPEIGEKTTFRPTEPARYVLEINAGMAQQSGIKLGQRAVFNTGDTR